MQVKALLDRAARLLPDSESARLDVELLLAHVTGRSRTWLYANSRYMLDAEQNEAFERMLAQRAGGTPVAYLTGTREFWSLPLRVTPAVLIPRPETELLVQLALKELPRESSCRIADLGTGSGAIALALASELPLSRIVATEASARALDVARVNANRLGVTHERLELRAGDWFEPLGYERFDCIVCNPPYVRDDDPHLERGDVRFEPREALSGGAGGLDQISRIIRDTPSHLVRRGVLILEHGHDQQAIVTGMLQDVGAVVEPHCDLAGVPRAVVARFKG